MLYVETACTVEHNGRTFEAGGAVVHPEFITAYVGKQQDGAPAGVRVLTDWHGNPLGTIRFTSSWMTPRSYMSSRMYQGRAVVGGAVYTGRTAGEGMVFRGKRTRAH